MFLVTPLAHAKLVINQKLKCIFLIIISKIGFSNLEMVYTIQLRNGIYIYIPIYKWYIHIHTNGIYIYIYVYIHTCVCVSHMLILDVDSTHDF